MITPAKRDRQVIIAVGDEATRRRLLSAVSGLGARVANATGVEEACAFARASIGDGVLILGRHTGRESLAAGLVRELRRKWPLLHVLVLYALTERTWAGLPHLARAGIDGWLFIDSPDADHLVRADIADRLRFLLPEDCAPLLRAGALGTAQVANTWCVRNAYRPISVEDIADHLSLDRSTIARHVRRTFAIRLEDVVDRARLLHVAALLDGTSSSVGVIARRLRFPSPEALHKFVKGRTQRSLGQLRVEGALGVTLDLFRRQVGVAVKVLPPPQPPIRRRTSPAYVSQGDIGSAMVTFNGRQRGILPGFVRVARFSPCGIGSRTSTLTPRAITLEGLPGASAVVHFPSTRAAWLGACESRRHGASAGGDSLADVVWRLPDHPDASVHTRRLARTRRHRCYRRPDGSL